MSKKDIDEIFSFQLFGWRSALFATAIINFFLPPLWEVSSIIGGVNFTAWNWAKGFSILANGVEIFVRPPSWAMIGALAFVVLGGISSLVRTRRATALTAIFAGLALWLAWEQIGLAERIAASHSTPGVLQIAIGLAKAWILLPLVAAILVCGYAATLADQKATFGPRAND